MPHYILVESTCKSHCVLQVVAEVYAAQDVVVKPHILLSLVLYKVVDPAQVITDWLLTLPGSVMLHYAPGHKSGPSGVIALTI